MESAVDCDSAITGGRHMDKSFTCIFLLLALPFLRHYTVEPRGSGKPKGNGLLLFLGIFVFSVCNVNEKFVHSNTEGETLMQSCSLVRSMGTIGHLLSACFDLGSVADTSICGPAGLSR